MNAIKGTILNIRLNSHRIQGCQMFQAHKIIFICLQDVKSWDKKFNNLFLRISILNYFIY